jgi:deazaflavin-dependent oxidoreductase (nitroreductase family)
MSQAVASTSGRPRKNFVLSLSHVLNPLMMLFAGTRLMPLYGVIQHVGRRSGKAFRTPVVVRRTEDGFIVPMPWGEGTDWFRNIRAAGGCVIRWKGRDYAMVEPEVIDAAGAQAAFNGAMQAGMTRFGIKQVAHLRFATSTERTVR